MSHQWIFHARLIESTRAQHTAIAASARLALGQRVVATVCKPVVEAESHAPLDDLSLRHRNERRLNAKLRAFDSRFGRKPGCSLECLDELGPAIGISRVVERVDADEDVIRP